MSLGRFAAFSIFAIVGLLLPRLATAVESKTELQQFVNFMKEVHHVHAEDITAAVRANFGKRREVTETYDSLRSYYRKNLLALGAQYPGGTLSFNFDAFTKFDGSLRPGGEDVFYAPVLAISPFAEVSLESMSFSKLRVDYSGKTISGLKVSGVLDPQMKKQIPAKSGKARFFLAYLCDINARVMGFRSGQMIQDISVNIEPAPVFSYNGILNWTEHHRYSREDQVKQPIALTNFAHQVGGDFNISDHPDFAMAIPDISSLTRMTFFLWKGEGKSGKTDRRSYPARLPDFIFQYEIRP